MAYLVYVEFKGLCPGVYTSWHETHAQVSRYRGGVYRGFHSFELAQQAYHDYIASGDTFLVQQPLHAFPPPLMHGLGSEWFVTYSWHFMS